MQGVVRCVSVEGRLYRGHEGADARLMDFTPSCQGRRVSGKVLVAVRRVPRGNRAGGKERVIGRAAREREKERGTNQLWREENVEKEEEVEEARWRRRKRRWRRRRRGWGTTTETTEATGWVGRLQRVTCPMSGMNESAHILLCTIRGKGSDM